jgi:FixJ family two-component response regulator
VDDEESVRRALERLLRSAGREVQTFSSGPEFLSSLEKRHPAWLALDIHMPGMTGFDVQARLNAEHIRMPTIAISAFDDPAAEPRALQAGATRFLRKPFHDQDLLRSRRGSSRFRQSRLECLLNSRVMLMFCAIETG